MSPHERSSLMRSPSSDARILNSKDKFSNGEVPSCDLRCQEHTFAEEVTLPVKLNIRK